MKITPKELAIQHVAKIVEYKKNRETILANRRELMRLSSNWAIRTTADVDFLETVEETELYYGALVSSDKKMRNYK